MTAKRKIFRNIGLAVFFVFIVIQFFSPAKNETNNTEHDISHLYQVPDTIQAILKSSCYDCHSNHTAYPWYNQIQPVAWWLANHINEGKRDLNFNEFTTYRINRQYNKLGKIPKEVNEGEMPIGSYTLIHRYAILSDGQKKLLSDWATAIHDSIQRAYPADSLKMPKRQKG